MYLILCFLFAFYSLPAFCLSPWEKHTSFLKYEKKRQEFEKNQEIALKMRLKELAKIRKQKQAVKKQKAFLEYQTKQKEFEEKRKRDFLDYKKEYKKYKQRQKNILGARLKQLKKLRKQEQALKVQKIFPEF